VSLASAQQGRNRCVPADCLRKPLNTTVRRHAGRDTYSAGGACFSARGKPASIEAQRGALEVQIVIAGLARFGSSRVPARTKIKWGLASASLKSGVPQLGQNRRCIRLPLSATLEKSLVFPTTLNVAVRKQAPTVPLPAPRYWQSRHQHTRVVIGGSALSQRTAPQRHLPVTVIAPPRSGTRVRRADRTLAPCLRGRLRSNARRPLAGRSVASGLDDLQWPLRDPLRAF